MEQLLSVSIIEYFINVHDRRIKSSNALKLISELAEFRELHVVTNKRNFKTYNGLSYETIEEYLDQDIYRILQTHEIYKARGYLLTNNTKQYDVERILKTDVETVVEKVINSVREPKKPTEGDSPILSINEIRVKYSLKRKSKHKKE